jgi:tRNA dimethylallyltransferase
MSEKPAVSMAGGAKSQMDAASRETLALIRSIPADRPVLIAGPTAGGKSALALAIAVRQGGVIVNADALQVFDAWPILTAQPGPQERAAAPHVLYGHLPPQAPWSVGHWLRAVAPILAGPRRPIIVGGTGLAFRALTEGLAEVPPVPAEVRAEGDALPLAALVAGLDPRTAARIDLRNRARVQRAWEVLRATGRGLAEWQAETPAPLLPGQAATRLVVWPETAVLDARIAARFDAMLAAGLLEEARRNAASWDPALPAARAIGASDLVAHVSGRGPDLEATRARIVTATRQYAKRQRTWLRARMADWRRLAP